MALLGKWFGFARDEVFEEGIAAYDRGDYEAAIDAFRACIKDGSDPDEVRLSRFYLAQSSAELGHEQMRAGHPALAAKFYDQALRQYPTYPDLNLAMAKACRELGDQERQNEYVQRALTSNPRFVDGILFQGITLYESERPEEALARVSYACQLDPFLSSETYQHALQCHADGDPDGCLRNLSAMCCSSSADVNLHLRIGDSYLRERRIADAIGEYRKALEIAPDHAEAHCRAGKGYVMVGMPAEAIEHLTAAVRLNPGDAEAHAQLGLAYQTLRREREAGREFEEALRLMPDHPVGIRHYGYAA